MTLSRFDMRTLSLLLLAIVLRPSFDWPSTITLGLGPLPHASAAITVPKGYRLIEGDMVIREELLLRAKFKKQLFQPDILWPNHGQNIPYYLSSVGYSDAFIATIRAALAHISNRTCVTFVEADPSNLPASYLNFIQDQRGCFSDTGYIDGFLTNINVNELDCNRMYTVAHEIGHGIGLFHTQSRPDRDQFVSIDLSVVDPSYAANFDLLIADVHVMDSYD